MPYNKNEHLLGGKACRLLALPTGNWTQSLMLHRVKFIDQIYFESSSITQTRPARSCHCQVPASHSQRWFIPLNSVPLLCSVSVMYVTRQFFYLSLVTFSFRNTLTRVISYVSRALEVSDVSAACMCSFCSALKVFVVTSLSRLAHSFYSSDEKP